MLCFCILNSLAEVDEVAVDLGGAAPRHGAEAAGDHQRQHEALPVALAPQHAAQALLPRTLLINRSLIKDQVLS